MKKKIIAIFLSVLMICTVMPMTVAAVQVADMPTSWQKLTNVSVVNDSEEGGEFVLRVSYTVGQDHSTLIDDLENQGNYSKYGLTSEAYPTSQVQVDWRIDEGAWHYDPIWDVADENRTGADDYLYYRGEAPYGNERAGSTYILRLPDQGYWNERSDWQDVMSAQGVTDITSNSNGYMQLDLEKHKVDVRIRLLTQVAGEDVDIATGEDNSVCYILSDWSDIASIGGGSAVTVESPTTLPVPLITNFAVSEAKNSGFVDDGYPIFTYNLTVPAEVEKITADATALGADFNAEVQVKTGTGDWTGVLSDGGWDALEITSGTHTSYMPELTSGDFSQVLGGESQVRVRYRWFGADHQDIMSEWCTPLTFNSAGWKSSEWATAELKKADEEGLIPEVLAKADLTQDITRAEFAAVCVKAYENLGNTTALPVVNNPFSDCTEVEVLKAYNVGITVGTSATKFSPNDLLNREQAATMLTRTFKRVTMTGWTMATDSQFTLDYTKPAAFADDKDISDWAKDSVYFMTANDIIKGVGNNCFAPQNITSAQQAEGYANATREQALVIAVRMVENLK